MKDLLTKEEKNYVYRSIDRKEHNYNASAFGRKIDRLKKELQEIGFNIWYVNQFKGYILTVNEPDPNDRVN